MNTGRKNRGFLGIEWRPVSKHDFGDGWFVSSWVWSPSQVEAWADRVNMLVYVSPQNSSEWLVSVNMPIALLRENHAVYRPEMSFRTAEDAMREAESWWMRHVVDHGALKESVVSIREGACRILSDIGMTTKSQEVTT